MAVGLKRRLFTVEEYHWMARVGILCEDDRVELIDGEVIEMTPIGRRHASCVAGLVRHFTRALGDDALVWPQNPIRLGERSEPQPDTVLLRPRLDLYSAVEPVATDVLLLIEVSDTTLEYDREIKVPLYAQSAIPEVWLVNLQQNTVTIYLDPTPDGYRAARVVRRGDQLAPSAFPDRLLAVSDILPG